MDRYVIADRENYEFVKEISDKGVITSGNLKEAIIFNDLNKAGLLFEYLISLENDYIIEVIEFKAIKEAEE